MSVQAYFDRLGAALERRWAAVGRDEEAFPDIAHDILCADPPADSFDKDAFAREQLDPTLPARPHFAPLGAFGQPSFTVFSGDGFLIDVYFWTNSLSAIHNHPFCGVFTVLDGHSVHAVYEFDERERVGPRVRLGQLTQTSVTQVSPGHVGRFSLAEHPLVHALIHVPVGAVSMVVRTARTVGYLRYLPPSLVVALEPPDQRAGRRLALLETLRQARDERFPEYLHTFLSTADFEASFLALARIFSDCDTATRADLLDRVRARHGARTDLLPEVIERSSRWMRANALREDLFDSDDRLVATALMVCETRATALSLIAERHADPIARLHRFVDERAPFGPDDPAGPILAHALVDGLDVAGAERRLVEHFGTENVGEQRDVVAVNLRESLFAALGG